MVICKLYKKRDKTVHFKLGMLENWNTLNSILPTFHFSNISESLNF